MVANALKFAEESPQPAPEELYRDVVAWSQEPRQHEARELGNVRGDQGRSSRKQFPERFGFAFKDIESIGVEQDRKL